MIVCFTHSASDKLWARSQPASKPEALLLALSVLLKNTVFSYMLRVAVYVDRVQVADNQVVILSKWS